MDIYARVNGLIIKLERNKNETISKKGILKELEEIAELYLNLDCIAEEDKLIGNEMWNTSQGYRQSKSEIKRKLKSMKKVLGSYEIKKKLENKNLKPGKVIIFKAGENYSAYDQLKRFFKLAKNNIDIIDPYLYPQTFKILQDVDKKLKIRLITNSKGFYKESKTDFNNFKKEYCIETRDSQIIHDRFFIIDRDSYFSGSSLHSVGNKLSAIALMNTEDAKILQKEFNIIWDSSKKIQ
ncbi:hypothetical protein A3D00_01480 [Candidatus Woesebacteria bacterium RIFCSPHIGHO2_02_FULL_38_9]|uniref:PLD phosphodiesterase domain-containing protein n=2 Tax=Candidatus Roizmaniibacteriota TaxID=1752723 RepID=A0A1F7JRV5_9BACT|nr:MAG: hypothetical protein A2966_02230 [Candidatus Roizmanbacteria bacterium RIFCSPLOWO2_01_FULL_41_22]OGK58334.1 MAG: hypothetical protein A3H86_03180 [Candidatus Roizmanbacteria bacterium RIFCSPLOWO2_02_FULL_41_9]OGM32114.1 MAG: hypothetical protein A3D00_01480 [Candidatus Woesebacteria bacterium RIFCSPHIGHO2_02_FULL_38_9]